MESRSRHFPCWNRFVRSYRSERPIFRAATGARWRDHARVSHATTGTLRRASGCKCVLDLPLSGSAMERRIIRAWCMYDWANSAYPLVISTALFPVYFSLIARDDAQAPLVTFAGVRWESASLYSLVIAASYAINALLVPVLSGIADWSGRKKTFLQVFCTLGAASCIGARILRSLASGHRACMRDACKYRLQRIAGLLQRIPAGDCATAAARSH